MFREKHTLIFASESTAKQNDKNLMSEKNE